MSKALRIRVKLFTRKDPERFGLSLLSTEVNHNKMIGRKMEVKGFGSPGLFEPAVNQFLAGLKPGQARQQLPGIGWGSNVLNDKQRSALESLVGQTSLDHPIRVAADRTEDGFTVESPAGSAFLDRLYRQKCSPEVPSYLLFGYRDESLVKSRSASDGIIPLKSQLDPRKQLTAHRVYGFDATHVGILNDKESQRVFNQILELATQK